MSRIIPFEGPDSYNIMFVGEAPGQMENELGRPFVSIDVARQANKVLDTNTAGELLESYMGRCGLSRGNAFLANLFKLQPPGNRFSAIRKHPELPAHIEELRKEIVRARPNVIVALGAWPMYYLTGHSGIKNKKRIPGTGIMTHRGSRYPCILPDCEGMKVYCSLHPAYVLRNWKMNPIFFHDIRESINDSKFPELGYPEYEEWIEPTQSELISRIDDAIASERISLDIETFPGGRYSCVGFAYKSNQRSCDVGVCTTYKQPYLADILKGMWNTDVSKTLQYGTYDISFMKNFYNWDIGGYYEGKGWDTYIAGSSIFPDYPRGLDFYTSIHTRFPYYKTERKVWKEMNDMNILWKYNIKDCIATMHIAEKQMVEIKEMFG